MNAERMNKNRAKLYCGTETFVWTEVAYDKVTGLPDPNKPVSDEIGISSILWTSWNFLWWAV